MPWEPFYNHRGEVKREEGSNVTDYGRWSAMATAGGAPHALQGLGWHTPVLQTCHKQNLEWRK